MPQQTNLILNIKFNQKNVLQVCCLKFMNSKEIIKKQLVKSGICNGDTLLVRAALRSLNIEKKSDFLEVLLEVIGPEGTLIGLSFSDSFFFPFISRATFTRESKTDSGGFSNMMLSHPKSYRSMHPTNSYVAIGKNAKYILGKHNENSKCYTPISKLLKLNGKMLLVGCIHSSPGFTTIHYAQEVLGLTEKSFLKNLKGIQYKDGNFIRKFLKKDYGGCSKGFNKFYSLYMNEGVLKQLKVGDATSLIIDANEAYKCELEVLKKRPLYLLCDDPLCLSCRATWKNNKKDILPFLINLFLNSFFKVKYQR